MVEVLVILPHHLAILFLPLLQPNAPSLSHQLLPLGLSCLQETGKKDFLKEESLADTG